jgi:plasmid stabilization system protein ParE
LLKTSHKRLFVSLTALKNMPASSKRFPEAGAACPDLYPGIRVLSHRGYAVYYRIHDDRVTVERVLAPGIDVHSDLFGDTA